MAGASWSNISAPEPLDVLGANRPEAAPWKMNGAEQPAGLPVADGVLVHAQHPSGVANVQQFLASRENDSLPGSIEVQRGALCSRKG